MSTKHTPDSIQALLNASSQHNKAASKIRELLLTLAAATGGNHHGIFEGHGLNSVREIVDQVEKHAKEELRDLICKDAHRRIFDLCIELKDETVAFLALLAESFPELEPTSQVNHGDSESNEQSSQARKDA